MNWHFFHKFWLNPNRSNVGSRGNSKQYECLESGGGITSNTPAQIPYSNLHFPTFLCRSIAIFFFVKRNSPSQRPKSHFPSEKWANPSLYFTPSSPAHFSLIAEVSHDEAKMKRRERPLLAGRSHLWACSVYGSCQNLHTPLCRLLQIHVNGFEFMFGL